MTWISRAIPDRAIDWPGLARPRPPVSPSTGGHPLPYCQRYPAPRTVTIRSAPSFARRYRT